MVEGMGGGGIKDEKENKEWWVGSMRFDDGIVDEKLDFKTVHFFLYSGTRERETLTLC